MIGPTLSVVGLTSDVVSNCLRPGASFQYMKPFIMEQKIFF